MKLKSNFIKPSRLRIFVALSMTFCALYGFTLFQDGSKLPASDKDNGGLILPGGFEAMVVIDSIGGGPLTESTRQILGGRRREADPTKPKQVRSNQGTPTRKVYQGNYFGARHIAVNANGDIYVKLRINTPNGEANASLRDINRDGKIDSVKYWAKYESGVHGTAMRIHNGYAYYTSEYFVMRSKLMPGSLIPDGKIDTIVIDDGGRHEHMSKAITFDGKGHLFVGWGVGSNSCQENNRVQNSPGLGKYNDTNNPCPMLVDHAAIWMFDENKLNQRQKDGEKYATGLRSVVAMDWDFTTNSLYAAVHGRDDFSVTWPEYYSFWESAMLPAEEFFKIPKGFDGGWPYYYYDQIKGKKMLNPEYGGDGKKEGDGAKLVKPLVGFPGHFAPNDLLFYKGNQFPARYKNGAFIAMHGSTNRPPYPQGGYIIVFVPMKNGVVTGDWEVFADGIAGIDPIPTAPDADYRPMGLAEGPDGSLYIGETQKGKIWRVMYKGNKAAFGPAQLSAMAKRKATASNIRTPDEINDNLEKGKIISASAAVYNTYCRACHQANGAGDGSRFPPVAESEWVNGDKTKLINVILNGLTGEISVKGVKYNDTMPAHGSFLKDKDVADVLTYIRSNFGNNGDAVTEAEVAAVRKSSGK